MKKLRALLNACPLLAIAVIFLFAGCSDSGLETTAVDPNDLATMTNNFTEGSAPVTQEVIDGLLKSGPPMDTLGDTMMPVITKTSFKNSREAFGLMLKPLYASRHPYLARIMKPILNYMVLGRPDDPQGVVAKMMGSEAFLAGVNPKITMDELSDPGPACVYISGLPAVIEADMRGETVDPSEAAKALEDLIKSFNITAGFDPEPCTIETGITGEGSINIKGGVDLKTSDAGAVESVSAKLTITFNSLKITVTDIDDTVTSASGAMSFGTDVTMSDTEFDFDFLFNAKELNFAVDYPEGGPVDSSMFMDGAVALNLSSPAVAPYPPLDTVPVAAIPDVCNMTMIVVVDLTIGINGAENWDILWGMKVVTVSSVTGPEGADVCSDGSYIMVDSIVFVYFHTVDDFYIVTFTSDPTYELIMTVTGSGGSTVTISIDYDDNVCVTDPDTFTCTWLDDYETDTDFTTAFGMFYEIIGSMLDL